MPYRSVVGIVGHFGHGLTGLCKSSSGLSAERTSRKRRRSLGKPGRWRPKSRSAFSLVCGQYARHAVSDRSWGLHPLQIPDSGSALLFADLANIRSDQAHEDLVAMLGQMVAFFELFPRHGSSPLSQLLDAAVCTQYDKGGTLVPFSGQETTAKA